MNTQKRFQSSAILRLGRTSNGGIKLYVVGDARSETGKFWVVAGDGARLRPALTGFGKQPNRGFASREDALRWGAEAFPTRERFKEFLSNEVGSAPFATAPEFYEETVDLWATANSPIGPAGRANQ